MVEPKVDPSPLVIILLYSPDEGITLGREAVMCVCVLELKRGLGTVFVSYLLSGDYMLLCHHQSHTH